MSAHDEAISTLNDLIQTCIDAEEGFHKAATEADDHELQTLLEDYSRLRRQMADDLSNEVRAAGAEPATSGSLSGSLHRGWMAVKATLTGKDDCAILAECERGEEVAIDRYRKALESGLPTDLTRLVRRQYNVYVASRERLRSLEKSQSHA